MNGNVQKRTHGVFSRAGKRLRGRPKGPFKKKTKNVHPTEGTGKEMHEEEQDSFALTSG